MELIAANLGLTLRQVYKDWHRKRREANEAVRVAIPDACQEATAPLWAPASPSASRLAGPRLASPSAM